MLAGCVAGSDSAALFPDDAFLRWSLGHRPGTTVTLARGLAVLAGTIAGRGGRQKLITIALCLTCLGVGQILRTATMALIARPRPPRAHWEAHASGWAFPSGHTTTAALTAALLIIAVLVRAPYGAWPPTA